MRADHQGQAKEGKGDGRRVRIRCALIQGIIPHYRRGLFRELDASDALDITFYSSGEGRNGIASLEEAFLRHHRRAPLRSRCGLSWQSGIVRAVLSREFDAVILMGDPHYLSSWVGAAVARMRGVSVLFWTHGWRRREKGVMRLLRLGFYRLANELLIYAERGKQLGISAGYPETRMTVIYNSLDLGRADEIVAQIQAGDIFQSPMTLFSDQDRPLLICTARLKSICRFDLLLRAAALLAKRGSPVNILLIGDGPVRTELEALASELSVDAHFTGAIYDEKVLGALLYHADITVSPGKVGLTAIHSMMYGTPVITHANLDAQMPEVETVVEGKTGSLFRYDDEKDLADKIEDWLGSTRDREQVRKDCRTLIHSAWSPHNQAKCIELGVEKAQHSKASFGL